MQQTSEVISALLFQNRVLCLLYEIDESLMILSIASSKGILVKRLSTSRLNQ